MADTKWAFAPTGGGSVDGINNPMISHFTGNFNYHLAREIIQNSLDAKLNADDPVYVKFTLEEFDKNDFPGYEEFKNILQECNKFWPKEQIDTHKFLNNALNCLENPVISVLKCSDYNTIGLEGADDDLKGSWFSLVKSRGASSKLLGEGGSFGIGKGAPFAASSLRAIFYFSKNHKSFPIFQGIAELVSFKKDNDVKRGSGSYGIDGYSSIRRYENIPRIFTRKSGESSGVDIYIMGFKKADNWIDELVKSVLRNFWYAIFKKELMVEVAETKIDKNSLEKLLIKYFANEKLKDDIEPTGNPLSYYNTIKSGLKFPKTLKVLGEVEFYFYEIPEHMNYVAMLRKPHMVVFSKAYRFPGNYCGVFICDNEKGNQVLRKMEPPAHNKWEPESYGDDGYKILNEIHEWIREILKSQLTLKPSGKLEIPDLYKYLPYDEGTEEGDGLGNRDYDEKESSEESSHQLQKKEEQKNGPIIKPYKPSISNKKEETGIGGGMRGDKDQKKNKNKKGEGVGGDSAEKRALTSKEIAIVSFINKKIPDGFEYLFIIKSDVDRKCSFKIFSIADDDSKDKTAIIDAFDERGTHMHVTGNRITRLDLLGKNVNKIFVHIKAISKIALKTTAYEL